MERVSIFCFTASYAVALALELWHQFRPRPVIRLLALGFGIAGLLAQTLYLFFQRPPLVGPFGWMLLLAWILAIFYLSGSVHHRRLAWGVFVLPLILGLVGLAVALGRPPAGSEGARGDGLLSFQDAWGPVHALLLFLAAVGLFAYYNQQDVTLKFFNWDITASLAAVIGVAYVLGMLSGWSVWGMLRRSLREVSDFAEERLTTARR